MNRKYYNLQCETIKIKKEKDNLSNHMKICENIHIIFMFIQCDQGFCFNFVVYKKFGKDFQKLKN